MGDILLPADLFAALLAVAVRPVLWTGAVIQLMDGAFGYSIHRSGMEVLYLPIPPETRNAVKGFIDMFVDRAARAASNLSTPAISLIPTDANSSRCMTSSFVKCHPNP